LLGLASAAAGAFALRHIAPASPAAAQTAPAATNAAAKTATGTHEHEHAHAATTPPSAAPTPAFLAALRDIVKAATDCQRDGRACLASCTDHLASGAHSMDRCQRAVMNMLSVTSAMAEVASYKNANPKQIAALAAACAGFCRACVEACEPHKDHHAECKACHQACQSCAQACEALPT
jgi:Cys-rich four helix bundle protein (predicted Tat secretion target)